MTEPVVITVYGKPAPQGSKRAFAVRGKGGVPTGRIAVIESSHDRVKAWRQAVVDAAVQVKAWPALDGPLEVRIVFYLPRPKSHYGTGRNAGRLRDTAPRRPSGKPDLGKLARATEDALTSAGIYRDDALITEEHLSKLWATDPYQQPGAWIQVTRLEGE